jgi:hypothetical protein
VKHINLDTQDEAVKRFVLGLTVDPAGSVLEMNGQPVALVVPPPKKNGAAKPGKWTKKKNDRRCDLIDREIDGVLTPEEAVELHVLQTEMQRFVNKVAPLPMEYARKLHQELLDKAAKAQNGREA